MTDKDGFFNTYILDDRNIIINKYNVDIYDDNDHDWIDALNMPVIAESKMFVFGRWTRRFAIIEENRLDYKMIDNDDLASGSVMAAKYMTMIKRDVVRADALIYDVCIFEDMMYIVSVNGSKVMIYSCSDSNRYDAELTAVCDAQSSNSAKYLPNIMRARMMRYRVVLHLIMLVQYPDEVIITAYEL